MDPGNTDEIPEMNLDTKYSTKIPSIAQNSEEVKKELDKTKKELEKIKSFVLKKYKFTQALSILPPQAMPIFVKEEEIPKDTEKFVQLYMVIPEDHFKDIQKIKPEIVKHIDSLKLKQKVWLQIKTPVDIFEASMDSKFEIVSSIAMSFPLYDDGFLGALRVAEIHKSLVLQKFEKYVVSYILWGSLSRGEAGPDSDVDVAIIINDTDVKRMPRMELKERLRSIIYQYIGEATALAGVKNRLEPQVWLLTDFWDGVKDAQPVYFNAIRDGIPLYDRGTFIPWKALLKMGKLKPSPEAIDLFMSGGDKAIQRAKKALMDIFVFDIYWSVITPSQALLMLNGLPPPGHKKTPAEMEKAFLKKEKILEKKYINILTEIVNMFRDYEHGKMKEIKGEKIDKLLKDTEAYLKRLHELRKQIEKRSQERTIEEIHNDVFNLLKTVTGKKSQSEAVDDFEKKLVKTGKFTEKHLKILDDVINAKAEFKKGKSSSHKIDRARISASVLINALVDYTQRCDLAMLERGRMRVKYRIAGKDQVAELLIAGGSVFLFLGKVIKKINVSSGRIEATDMMEVTKSVEDQKTQKNLEISPRVFELLEKELGEFEIVL